MLAMMTISKRSLLAGVWQTRWLQKQEIRHKTDDSGPTFQLKLLHLTVSQEAKRPRVSDCELCLVSKVFL